MEENINKTRPQGFKKGLDAVFNTCTAAQYSRCLAELKEVCTTTEARRSSISTYYNKMRGTAALSVAGTEKLNEVFARYGITDWQGIEQPTRNK